MNNSNYGCFFVIPRDQYEKFINQKDDKLENKYYVGNKDLNENNFINPTSSLIKRNTNEKKVVLKKIDLNENNFISPTSSLISNYQNNLFKTIIDNEIINFCKTNCSTLRIIQRMVLFIYFTSENILFDFITIIINNVV